MVHRADPTAGILVLRRLPHGELLEAFGNILVLPLTAAFRVDDGVARHFLVWLGQFIEERIDFVLNIAAALAIARWNFSVFSYQSAALWIWPWLRLGKAS